MPDRLAELREMVAQRRREFPPYPDTPEEREEHLLIVEAMAPLQAEVILSTQD